MNGRDLLVPDNEMSITNEQAEETRISILQDTSDVSTVELLRKKIENRKKALSVVIDESRMNSAHRLAQSLASLGDILLSDEVLEAVRDGIISSKDPAKSYNEFTKAFAELDNRLMKQQLTSANPEAPSNTMAGKSIKVAVADASGAVMVSIGGDE